VTENNYIDGKNDMILDKVEIFDGLTQPELEALSASSVVRSYPKNTVIINENDHADSLYIIESGRVKVYCSDKNGKEFIMNTLTTEDYFGELALLDDDKRSASVRTMEKSGFCIIYKEDFNKVLEQQPNIAKTLIRNLTRRVRKLTKDVKALALQDVYGRVTNVLSTLSEPREDGTSIIPEKLTQQDIADRVGASREMVARILKDLTIGEYISFEGRNIILNSKLPDNY
jgi:CRP/FNR family cyclic AMP-dependent transcriptional regulator